MAGRGLKVTRRALRMTGDGDGRGDWNIIVISEGNLPIMAKDV
jgi:hypothetical protein